MAEYISREALIDCLRKERSEIEIWEDDDKAFNLGVHQGYVFAIHDAKSIPAADVRPVVLCRDCKNNYNTCLNHGINEPMCDFTDRKLREDDFCSRGERREES